MATSLNTLVPSYFARLGLAVSYLWVSLNMPLGAQERPNLVVIMADDLGFGDLGCYGSEDHKTPNLDRLASEGVRFLDYHSNGPVCSPTRAALLTGRYQQRSGIGGVIYAGFTQNRHHGLQRSEETFAGILRRVGYKTAAIGKWHLGYRSIFNPIHHGFEVFHGYVSGNIDYQNHFDRMGVLDWWEGDQVHDRKGYSTHLITDFSVAFIDQHHDRPFCLYVAHEAPHDPFQGPLDPGFRISGKVVNEVRSLSWKKRAYREMVEALDEGVGKILAALERHGLEENTFVFFCSDNGATRFGSNGALRNFKGTVWEGGIRVPAIARWPERIQAGSVCHETILSMDIMPTLLALAGHAESTKKALDGESFLPAVTETGNLSERALVWEYGERVAVRRGDWKLVGTRKANEGTLRVSGGLFDLSVDMAEQTDLQKMNPEMVAELREAYRRWRRDVNEDATAQPGDDERMVNPFLK